MERVAYSTLSQPFLPLVYAGFDEFRQSQEALTYDDFIPTAIDILEYNPSFYRRFCGSLQHLIVDEYFQYKHAFQRYPSGCRKKYKLRLSGILPSWRKAAIVRDLNKTVKAFARLPAWDKSACSQILPWARNFGKKVYDRTG